jgi:hypothetical protein
MSSNRAAWLGVLSGLWFGIGGGPGHGILGAPAEPGPGDVRPVCGGPYELLDVSGYGGEVERVRGVELCGVGDHAPPWLNDGEGGVASCT